MPSFNHDFLVDLFRKRGEVAAELLHRLGIAVDYARVELRSIDLSQVTSTEYRADAVVILHDTADQAAMGVIVEVQRGVDGDKRLSWPVYVTALRARLDLPVLLLVIAPERDIAAWARKTIDLGHPGFRLTPLVIGFDDVPRIENRAEALRLPELAVLSVLAHPELEIAEAAIDAIITLPEEQSRLYLDVIIAALPDALRQILEARMQGYEYQSEFARKYFGQGREQGREEGLEKAARNFVLELASDKLGTLTTDEMAAIEAIRDVRVLNELVRALGKADGVAAARAVFAQALRP